MTIGSRRYHAAVRAVRAQHRSISYSEARAAVRALRASPSFQRTERAVSGAAVKRHPTLTARAVSTARRFTLARERDRGTIKAPAYARAVHGKSIPRSHGPRDLTQAEKDSPVYADAPYSTDDDIEDLDSFEELIDYFDEMEYEDYEDVEVEANADYEETPK